MQQLRLPQSAGATLLEVVARQSLSAHIRLCSEALVPPHLHPVVCVVQLKLHTFQSQLNH
jgi:hypothetical protein